MVHFFCESCILFIGLASTDFSKFFFKIEPHSTIHIFKNYFAKVFSVFYDKMYPNIPVVSKQNLFATELELVVRAIKKNKKNVLTNAMVEFVSRFSYIEQTLNR